MKNVRRKERKTRWGRKKHIKDEGGGWVGKEKSQENKLRNEGGGEKRDGDEDRTPVDASCRCLEDEDVQSGVCHQWRRVSRGACR